jgi:hypothetical protein
MTIAPLWRAFHRFHRFYWVGVHAGLAVGRCLGLPAYRLRNLMIALDGLLSSGAYASGLALPFAAVVSIATGNPVPLMAALTLALIFRALGSLERELRRRYWLKRFDIYDIDTGSARTLMGHVVVGHIFVEERGSRYWTNSSVAAAMGRSRRAGQWLVQQASSYGACLEVSHQNLGARRSLSRGTQLRLEELEACVASETLAFVEANRSKDGFCIVVHVPFDTINFAMPASLIHQHGRPVEWCLVMARANEAVIAHELLHLFGGDDHYHCSTAEERRAKRELIGRSIMFGADRALAEQVVDGVTAQNVGWM